MLWGERIKSSTCFLIEESFFNYILSNSLSLHKFVNSIDCSIFTTTSSSLIKSILSSKKIFLFHHHHKKGLTHPTTYLSSPLLYAIKKEVYFSINYATKSILIIQVIFDIEHMNHFSSETFPTLCCMIHMTSNYCVVKEDVSAFYLLWITHASFILSQHKFRHH